MVRVAGTARRAAARPQQPPAQVHYHAHTRTTHHNHTRNHQHTTHTTRAPARAFDLLLFPRRRRRRSSIGRRRAAAHSDCHQKGADLIASNGRWCCSYSCVLPRMSLTCCRPPLRVCVGVGGVVGRVHVGPARRRLEVRLP